MRQFILLAIFTILSSASFAQNKVTVKAGTIIPLQSTKQVKAADVNEGEMVDFKVMSDVIVDNVVAVPYGTIVKGVVNEARKSTVLGTKGRLVININNLILPSGEHIFFSNTAVRVYGQNRTPLAVVTGLFVWPCLLIPGTKAVMPEGYEVHAYVAANAEVTVK